MAMYPSRTQYKNAVMNQMFPSSENGGYSFESIIVNGEAVISAGGNATVFKVKDAKDETFALKFFNQNIESRLSRLEAISSFLNKSSYPFFSHFSYVSNLIYVEMPGLSEEECYFPGIIMRWIEADTLESKLRDLVQSKRLKEIKTIATRFKEISLTLLRNGIAHGDLKLSNILIDDKLNLFLIDYDGMYVPELKGLRSIENGTPSYQHPNRTEDDFNERIDHFSILNIYTSLIALANFPTLYSKYNDGDNIIFTKEDFDAPDKSDLFKTLSKENETKGLVFFLKQSLANGSIYIDNIVDLLNGKFPTPKITITHSPAKVLIGELVKISWRTEDAGFVTVNGTTQPLQGFVEEVVENGYRLVFEYGNNFDTFRQEYKIESLPKPEIISFNASETALKFDENLSLNWGAKNFKKAIIRYGQNEIDVTDRNKYVIAGLSKDTTVTLILHSLVNNFKLEKSIKVEVYYPVSLEISQERKIAFPNRSVRISIDSKNEQKLTLSPLNIDLTGKKEYFLKTDRDISFSIVAENKRYSISRNSAIEILKPPAYTKKVVALPNIEFRISAPKFAKFQTNSIRSSIPKIDLASIKFNEIMDRVNIFKILSKNEWIK